MDWKNGYSEDSIIAQVQIAPTSVVGEIIERYKIALNESGSSFVIGPYASSKDFEEAIFSRNDSYLNLLLASTVTDDDLVIKLWNISESSNNLSEQYKSSIKESLLKGHSLPTLLKEVRWGNPNENWKISLVELLTAEDFNATYAYWILSNPYSKGFLKKILLREDEYSKISDKTITYCLRYIADNKALNVDKSDNESPDLTHWDVEKAITSTFQNAPQNSDWFYALSSVLDKLEGEVFSFYEFPVREFANKWLSFTAKGMFADPDDVNKSEAEGYYTTLTESKEFVSLFCAKFGRSLIQNKKLKVSVAIGLEDIAEKSAFFGNAYLSPKEVEEALHGGDPNIVYWLLYNNTVMRNQESRQLIKEYVGDGARSWIFKQRIDYLKVDFPENFVGEVSASGNDNSEKFSQLSESLSLLVKNSTYVTERVKKLEDSLKTIGYFLVIASVVAILKSCF